MSTFGTILVHAQQLRLATGSQGLKMFVHEHTVMGASIVACKGCGMLSRT